MDPQPGDWVLIRAKVLERPFPETVLVELFSKTDQYPAHVRPDLCVQIVPKPVPDKPDVDSVVLLIAPDLRPIAFQHVSPGMWFSAGATTSRTWADLNAVGDVEVIHHA